MIEICFEEKNDAMHVYRQLLKRAELLYKETSVYLQKQKVVIHIPVCESNYIEKDFIAGNGIFHCECETK